MSEFVPTKWWRVQDSNGHIWMETTNAIEAAREHQKMGEGFTLHRLYARTGCEWRKESPE